MTKPKEIVEDEQQEGMYRLKWPNGKLSEDYYNKSRATEILRNPDRYDVKPGK